MLEYDVAQGLIFGQAVHENFHGHIKFVKLPERVEEFEGPGEQFLDEEFLISHQVGGEVRIVKFIQDFGVFRKSIDDGDDFFNILDALRIDIDQHLFIIF